MNPWPASVVLQSLKTEPVAHKIRREVANETTLVRNRVLYLKMTSEKALKLAEKARREEQQVLDLKIDGAKLEEQKILWLELKKSRLQESRIHAEAARKRRNLELQEVKDALLKYKQEEKNAIKKQSEAIRKLRRQAEENERNGLAEKVNCIRDDEKLQKFRKRLYFERKLQYFKLADNDVQKQHMSKINDHLNEMKGLENIESSLIEKVKKSHHERYEAYKNIEKIIAMPEDVLKRSFDKLVVNQSIAISPVSFAGQPGTPFRRSFFGFSRNESPEPLPERNLSFIS